MLQRILRQRKLNKDLPAIMKTAICQSLDDFLSGCLNDDENAAFEKHLVKCPECQERKSQTQAIERMLSGHNADLTMRPQWHEQLLGTLRDSTNETHQVDAKFVEISKAQYYWRPVVAIAASVLAASIFLSMSRLPIKPNDIDRLGTNTANKATSQIDQSKPKQVQEFRLASVQAAPGYLCARVESDQPDIEFYVVLPSATIVSIAAN